MSKLQGMDSLCNMGNVNRRLSTGVALEIPNLSIYELEDLQCLKLTIKLPIGNIHVFPAKKNLKNKTILFHYGFP